MGLAGVESADFSALLSADQRNGKRTPPSTEMLARWRQLGEHFGGSSWGGWGVSRSLCEARHLIPLPLSRFAQRSGDISHRG